MTMHEFGVACTGAALALIGGILGGFLVFTVFDILDSRRNRK